MFQTMYTTIYIYIKLFKRHCKLVLAVILLKAAWPRVYELDVYLSAY